MDRRQYLLTLATVGTVSVAGCTGDEGDDDGPQAVDGDDRVDDSTDDTAADDGGEATGDNGADTGDDESDTSESDGRDVTAVIGDLVESDRMQLVIEDFERGVDFGEYIDPDPGNEFATVLVALKNKSDGFVNVSNLLQTRIRDEENYTYRQTFFGGDGPTFNGGQFAPGEVERGAINFEIPEDADGLELVWDFSIGLFTDIDRVTVDLEERTTVHTLEQDLQIEVHSVGTTVEFEGTEVTVNEMRTESSLGSWAQPDAGNEYAIVDISIENQTGEQQRISTILQMLVKDETGISYQEDFSATAELNRSFDESTPIADAETRRGEVVYEVPEGRSPLYWVFEFSLWTDGDKTFWQLR